MLFMGIIFFPIDASAKENDVFMFYGKTCPYCQGAKDYLKTLFKDYPDLKVYLFEVWEDTPNQKLFQKVSKEIGNKKKSVPLIVIGDKYYVGYDSSFNEEILNSIVTNSSSLMNDEYLKEGNYTLITKDGSITKLNKYYINKKDALSIGLSIFTGAIILVPILIFTGKSKKIVQNSKRSD